MASTALPTQAERYHRTRVFTTVPLGQRHVHRMRHGTWSRVHVLDGALAVVDDARHDRHVLFRGEWFDLPPGVDHHVEPWGPRVRFFLDLFRVEPQESTGDAAIMRWEGEGGASSD